MNIFTCPVFVFYPCQPHPKGNKCHTIFCGEIGIMCGWDIVKGGGHTTPMVRPESNMVGIMFQPMRALWSTGKALITGSRFYFLKGLLEMTKRGFMEVH